MSKHDKIVFCEACNESIDGTTLWCTPCNAKRFKDNSLNWTSDNDEMDKFILETQTIAKRHETVLEWVDPSKFTLLEKIEYSKNHKAYWKDGFLLGYNVKEKDWNRNSGRWIKLVTHYCEKYLIKHFLKSEHEFSKTNPSERLVYGMTRDPLTNEYAVIEKLEERCTSCHREWMSSRWCRGCYSNVFEEESRNWTSGNTDIDEFICEAQMTAEFPDQVLEWIPESHLTDITEIGKGGYGSVFKAYRKIGRICKRDFNTNKWIRDDPMWVALKYVEEEKEDNVVELLKETKAMHRCLRTDMYFLDFYGISRYTEKKKYVIVMRYVEGGDLRKYLFSNFTNNSWNNRIDKLWGLAIDLRTLHLSDLVHRDLHSGNVLFGDDRRSFIADFGLTCKDGQTQEKDVKGVLPYVAPELLIRQPHTKATDVYSFGIIMWEWTSYQPPFCDIGYDIQLALRIHEGLRPPVIQGTPECYSQLMCQCWDRDPTKRPTAHVLAETLDKWHHILSNECEPTEENDQIMKQFELAEQERQRNPFLIQPNYENTHPMAILTSRILPTFSLPSSPTEENSQTFFPDYQTTQYDLMIKDLMIKDNDNVDEDDDDHDH